jgi:hypothetical protein
LWVGGPVCPHCGVSVRLASSMAWQKRQSPYRTAEELHQAALQAVHGARGYGFRVGAHSAAQDAASGPPALQFQEGHERPPTPPDLRGGLQARLIFGSPNSGSDARWRPSPNGWLGRHCRSPTRLTLYERGGVARSFHTDGHSLATIVPIIRQNIRRESKLITDAANYKAVRKGVRNQGLR